jgi:hypothetical protein
MEKIQTFYNKTYASVENWEEKSKGPIVITELLAHLGYILLYTYLNRKFM